MSIKPFYRGVGPEHRLTSGDLCGHGSTGVCITYVGRKRRRRPLSAHTFLLHRLYSSSRSFAHAYALLEAGNTPCSESNRKRVVHAWFTTPARLCPASHSPKNVPNPGHQTAYSFLGYSPLRLPCLCLTPTVCAGTTNSIVLYLATEILAPEALRPTRRTVRLS